MCIFLLKAVIAQDPERKPPSTKGPKISDFVGSPKTAALNLADCALKPGRSHVTLEGPEQNTSPTVKMGLSPCSLPEVPTYEKFIDDYLTFCFLILKMKKPRKWNLPLEEQTRGSEEVLV